MVPSDASDVRTLGNRLAGKYELTLVPTQAADAKPRIKWLYLSLALDTAARRKAGYADVRSLKGWAVPVGADSTASERIPAALFEAALEIGEAAHGPPREDGTGTDFSITAVSLHGFWGWWADNTGIAIRVDLKTGNSPPTDAGYFCARRLP